MFQTSSHLGPIPAAKEVVTVAKGRVEGVAVMPPKSDPSGRGHWIWTDGAPYAARFKKQLSLSKIPSAAFIRITSECSYRLYVNNQIVARGPGEAGRD